MGMKARGNDQIQTPKHEKINGVQIGWYNYSVFNHNTLVVKTTMKGNALCMAPGRRYAFQRSYRSIMSQVPSSQRLSFN